MFKKTLEGHFGHAADCIDNVNLVEFKVGNFKDETGQLLDLDYQLYTPGVLDAVLQGIGVIDGCFFNYFGNINMTFSEVDPKQNKVVIRLKTDSVNRAAEENLHYALRAMITGISMYRKSISKVL